MGRPKKGTKAGDIATAKFKATMEAKHGNISEFMRKIGAIGGKNGTTGGWAKKTPCDCPAIAGQHTKPQCRGKLGGTNSRRGKASE